MKSDRLISLIVFIQEKENVQKIHVSIAKSLDLLKENADHYELIIVTDRTNKFFEDLCREVLNDFKNVCFIQPTIKIDVDIALTLGLVNSIGDKAVCFREDSDFSLVKQLVSSEEKSNIFIRSKNNDSLNIFLVHRSTINALIHLFGNTRIKLLERTLSKMGHPFIVERERRVGYISIKTRYLKKLRIIYNEYFVRLVALLIMVTFLLRAAEIILKNDYYLYFDMLIAIFYSVVVLLFAKRVVDSESKNTIVNYRIDRSDFVDIKKLNVLR